MAVLSPVAVVKNGLILATIWRRDFARTLLHIFLCRLAITDLLGDLIGGPLHALSVLVKAFTGSMLSQDNSLLFVFSFLKLSFFPMTFSSFSMTICPQIVMLCLFRHHYYSYHHFGVI